MLVVNKWLMKDVPLASTVTSVQFIICVLFCEIGKASGQLADIDAISSEKVFSFMYYIMSFVLGIYFNMKALAVSNVETLIVFRTCTPICVAFLDWLILGRQLPDARSAAALLVIVLGSYVYVYFDKQYEILGLYAYMWPFFYFFSICFNMTYGKHLMMTSKLKDPIWGSVYYTNTLSIVPMLILGFAVGNEGSRISTVSITPIWSLILFCSGFLGIIVSYSGFQCRSKMSATGYTVVGVANKMITIMLSTLLMDDHSTFKGIMGLILCVAGSVLYRQAPLRREKEEYIPVIVDASHV